MLLPESPSTGYRWHLDDPPAGVVVLAALFQEAQGAGPTAGSAGVRAFLLDPGPVTPVDVVFVLRRPWETEPTERRVVTVLPPAPAAGP